MCIVQKVSDALERRVTMERKKKDMNKRKVRNCIKLRKKNYNKISSQNLFLLQIDSSGKQA